MCVLLTGRYESGNQIKDLLGQGGLKWDENKKQVRPVLHPSPTPQPLLCAPSKSLNPVSVFQAHPMRDGVGQSKGQSKGNGLAEKHDSAVWQ